MLCDGMLYECINGPSNRNSFHWNGNSLMVSDVGTAHTHSQTHMQICWRFMVFLQTFEEPLPLSFNGLRERWSRKPQKLRTMSCLLSVWIPARAFGLSYFSCILKVLEDCQAFTSVFAYCLIAHFKNWSTDKASAEPVRNRCSTPWLVEWWRTICSYSM